MWRARREVAIPFLLREVAAGDRACCLAPPLRIEVPEHAGAGEPGHREQRAVGREGRTAGHEMLDHERLIAVRHPPASEARAERGAGLSVPELRGGETEAGRSQQ